MRRVNFTKGCQILFLAILFLPNLLSAQEQDTLRVLFVGNSYTYFGNLPQSVQLMAESRGIPLVTKQSTAGGASLKQHWKGEKELKSKDIIASGNWDIVILQNHSLSTIEDKEGFLEYGKLFTDFVKKNNAEPYLYTTWAREYNPLMQSQITAVHEQLAAENKIPTVDAGSLWMWVSQLRPDIELYDPDNSHPSAIGTYLTACLFFKKITGQSPVGLPSRLITKDQFGEKLYVSIIGDNDAQFLQQAAAEFGKR